MNRKEYVLAVLSSSRGETFSPVQVQKLFFLLDKKIADIVNNGMYFNFTPYDYGPFDVDVYNEINELERDGLAETIYYGLSSQQRYYHLTNIGQQVGEEYFSTFEPNIQDFVLQLTQFVRRLSFKDLVLAIYREYPEMRENSIFRG